MNKDIIEIERTKHIAGYGRFSYLTDSSEEILNKIVEWSYDFSQKLRLPVIYKHKVRYVEENISKEEFYFFDGGLEQMGEEICPTANIPYCDLVCYLDIYYQ